MNKLARLAAAGVVLCLLTPSARAENEGAVPDESAAIEKRLEVFYGDRGMWTNPDPQAITYGRRRAEAALQAIALTEAQKRSNRAPAIWTSIGPAPIDRPQQPFAQTGRVTGLAIDPTDPNIIYLSAASGGVWKTTSGGTSWVPLWDQQATQTIGAVAIAPTNHNEIWVGTGDYNGDTFFPYFGMGVYRSTDAGASWQARNGSGSTAMILTRITSVLPHPTNPNIIVVSGNSTATSTAPGVGGIFYTSDAGSTWTEAYTGNINEAVRDPSNANIVYASGATPGCTKSTDGGVTWNNANTGLVVSGRAELAISPSSPTTLYCVSGNTDLYRTTNGGGNWTLANSNACESQCGYNLTMKVSLNDPNTVYVAGLRPFKSTNGGTTLTALSGYGIKLHPDVQHMEPHPTDPNTLYVGTDGGLWKTTDGGTTFTNLNGNLGITQFYDGAVHPTIDTIGVGGAQDNGTSRYLGTINWTDTGATGDGMTCVISPVDPLLWYITTYPGVFTANGPTVFRSTNGGAAGWPPISPPITEAAHWITPVAVDPVVRNTVYVGATSVWKSTDTGTTWTKLAASTFTNVVRAISVAPSNGNIIYATAAGQVKKTTDGGTTWADVRNNLPSAPYFRLTIDPADPNHVYASMTTFLTTSMWYTIDGGATWTAATSGLPQIATNDVLLLRNPTRVYVATDVGIFVGGSDAGPYSPDMVGMPQGVPVSDFEYNDTTHTITAFTYGRSAFQKDAAGTFLADVTVGKGAAPPAAYDTVVNGYRVDGTQITQINFSAYTGGSGYGVNTAGGDVTGDGLAEIIAGQGPGNTNPPLGKGFTRAGAPISGINFAAYGGTGFGLNVAAGDLDGDNFDEMLTGPGEGPTYGPQVRGWNYDNSGTTTAMAKINFFAYGTLKYGVNVAAISYDADTSFKEILTGAGPGDVFGPHVRGWNYDNTTITPSAKVSFFAFSTLKYGVNVSGGDVDNDAFDEIIPGAGPGAVFGAQVRGFNVDAGSVTSMSKINFVAYAAGKYGVNVACGDLEGDRFAEIATGQGPDPTVPAVLKGWNFDATAITEITAMDKTVFSGLNYGITVGIGVYGY